MSSGASWAHLDATVLRPVVVQYPVTSGRDQLRPVGDLIHGDKANAESARGSRFTALVTGGDTAETVEVAPVLAGFLRLPRAFGLLDLFAVTEDTVIVDDKGIVTPSKLIEVAPAASSAF